MRTHSRIRHVGLFIALAWAAAGQAAAEQDVSPPAVYLYLDAGQAGFSSEVLDEAKAQVTRIYRQAGINTVWISDREHYAAMAPPVPGPLLDVLIRSNVAGLPNRSDSLVGLAPGGGSGRGTTAFIFSDGVRRAARKYQIHHVGPAHVLAMAIAHEVGHLLLPAGHSNAGVMRADWDVQDFALAVRGMLLFNAQQGELMRAQLQQRQDPQNANDYESDRSTVPPKSTQCRCVASLPSRSEAALRHHETLSSSAVGAEPHDALEQ
jgi:hypothetical protein